MFRSFEMIEADFIRMYVNVQPFVIVLVVSSIVKIRFKITVQFLTRYTCTVSFILNEYLWFIIIFFCIKTTFEYNYVFKERAKIRTLTILSSNTFLLVSSVCCAAWLESLAGMWSQPICLSSHSGFSNGHALFPCSH